MKNIIKVLISNSIPTTPEKTDREGLCEKVDRFIEAIESNIIDSEFEYNYLKALYKKLIKCKRLNPKYKDLRVKLKDVMMKHGKYDNDSEILNAEDLFLDQDNYTLDDY